MGKGRSKEGDASRGSPVLDVETLLRRAGAITPRVRATVRAPAHTRNHGLRGGGKHAWVHPNQRKEVLRMVGEVACGDHAFPWCVAPTDMNNDT
jgi:hypothetical protein